MMSTKVQILLFERISRIIESCRLGGIHSSYTKKKTDSLVVAIAGS